MSMVADQNPWTDEVVTRYLTATAQQKDDPETFYDTHLDIDKIHAEFLPRYQETFINQETFRDELTDAPIDANIRTFIVRGETGSGKSQLCQWLNYELAGEGESEAVSDRIPLHIKANQTNLEHIIQTLAEPLGVDPEIRQVTSLEADRVANAIISNLTANPGQKLDDAGVDRIVDEGDLEALLQSNIERYQRGLEESDETEFDPNLITRGDYRDIALELGTGSVFHENSDILRQALRDEIHRHFSHVIGVDDFQGQLRDYAQRYVDELGKRPVIICEDVTTFSVLKEQLLDQIIQVESAAYDIVLGYTTGFEQDDLQDALGNRGDQDALTYLKDRAEGYLSLTQDGNAYFLNHSLSVDLVRKYMDVIKRESGAEVEADTEAAFDDLYPFNRSFIKLAYNNLLEDGSPRRTPRVLLQKVVRRVLLSDDDPHEVAEKSPNIDSVVTPIDPTLYNNELQKLATWYGYRDNTQADSDRVLLHPAVLDLYGFNNEGEETIEHDGVEYVSFYPDEAATQILGEGDERPPIPPEPPTKIDVGPDMPTEDEGDIETETSTDTSSTTTTSTVETRSTTTDNETQSRRKQQYKELVEWTETGDSYPSSDVLRRGAESVLEMWYDSTRFGNPNASTSGTRGIYYTRGGSVPVSVEGPDERDGLSVTLSFGKENLGLYRQLFRVGMNDGEIPDSATVEQLRSWATDSVVGFRADMRKKIESCLPPGMQIEHTILLARFLLTNAEFGGTRFGPEAVFDKRKPIDRNYDSPIRDAFHDDTGIQEALGKLQSRRSDINGLINGFFLLKKNFVDHERLGPARGDINSDVMKYTELAQQIDTERLDFPSAYNIGTTRSNASIAFASFLNAVSDYAVELALIDDDDLRDYFEESVEPVENWHDPDHTVDDLADMLGTLLDCLGTFGETKSEQWDKLHADLAADDTSVRLGPFGDRVDTFIEPNTDSPIERMRLLHEFQRSREKDRAWDVYEVIGDIVEKLEVYNVDENDDIEEQIRDLQEISEYESARSKVTSAIDTY